MAVKKTPAKAVENQDVVERKGIAVSGKKQLRNKILTLHDPNHPAAAEIRSELFKHFSYCTVNDMMQDPVISFAIRTMSAIIISLPWSMHSDDPLQESLVAQELEKNYTDMMNGFTTAIYNGYAFGQKIYQKEHKTIYKEQAGKDGKKTKKRLYSGNVDGIHRVKFINPTTSSLRYFVDRKTEELKYVTQMDYYTFSPRKELKVKRNNLVWFGGEYAFDKIFGRSRLIDAYLSWEIIKILKKYLLEGVDANSGATVGIRYPDQHVAIQGEQVHGYDIAQALLDDFINGDTYYAVPSSVDHNGNPLWGIEISKDVAAASADVYDTIKDLIIMEYNAIMMALGFPPALNPIDESKDLANSETSMELLMLIMQPFVQFIEDTICKDFIDDVLTMNFTSDEIVSYRFEIDKSVFNRRSLMKELTLKLVTIAGQGLVSGSAISNYFPDMRAILEQLNVPQERVEEIFKTVIAHKEAVGSEALEPMMHAQGVTGIKRTEHMAEQDPAEMQTTADGEAGGGSDEEGEEVTGIPRDDEEDNKIREESREAQRTPRTIQEGSRKRVIPGA